MKKISILIVMIIFMVGCTNSLIPKKEPYKYEEVLLGTDSLITINVSEFTIYGKYFNLAGNFVFDKDITELTIVFKSSINELEYDVNYQKDDNNLVIFKTNKYINEGINLENVLVDDYVILLKITSNEEIKYYNMLNQTSYDNLEYYTITKDNSNNYIKIMFDNYESYNFMKLEISKKTDDKEIYDIIIDPGHGGKDPGAVNGKYQEKTYNIEYARLLKSALEEIGLKVKLTREDDTLPKEYGVNSRTGIPYETKAKLMLSLHLNSTWTYIKDGGVEIYIANGDKTDFAKVIADNIVANTTTSYSPNKTNRVINGVYLRTYKQSDINGIKKIAKQKKWTPYEKMNTSTTYYYFIRETGGIITNAMTDGRNPEYEENPYYMSNHGVEAYLLELGYISNAANLKKIINEKDGYIKGIVESVKYYINN